MFLRQKAMGAASKHWQIAVGLFQALADGARDEKLHQLCVLMAARALTEPSHIQSLQPHIIMIHYVSPHSLDSEVCFSLRMCSVIEFQRH